jgi:cytochrome c oxidase subunit 2
MTKAYLLLFVITGALSGLAFIDPSFTEQPKQPNLRVVVTARRFAFQPAEITLKKGQQVDLVLKTADVAHGIRFHELNLDVKVNKGATAEVLFTPDKTGNFVGHCSVFCGSGHGSMELTIHVVE